MNKNLLALGAAAILCGIVYAVFPFGKTPVAPTCDYGKIGLADPAPLELAAIYDYDCARSFIAQDKTDPATLAWDLSYPSLMQEGADFLGLIQAVVTEGDRGFFTADPMIAARLKDQDLGPETARIQDFVGAIFEPEKTFAASQTPQQVVAALPLWNSDPNAKLVAKWCKTVDCASAATVCPTVFGLADKAGLATGALAISDAIALCEPSFDWILALRRAGVIDTSCSSVVQANLGISDPAYLAGPCFPADKALSQYRAWGSIDTARYLRATRAQKPVFDAADLEVIARRFPDAAEYFRATGTAE